jgi:hypothetical protein
MRKTKIAIGLATLSLLAGCTGEMESKPLALTEKQAELLNKEIGGKVAGKPVSCISAFNSDNIIRVNDEILLFRQSGRLVYQNKLRGRCPGLARDNDVLVMEQFGSQKCNGDRVRLVDRIGGIPGPVCILGDFVPYRKTATGS